MDESENRMSQVPKERDLSRSIYEWAEELTLAIVIVVAVFSFVFRVVTVNGTSMLPNYDPNDRLIVSAFTGDIKQGDVVIVVDTLDNPIIKRVIATEGQSVDIDFDTGIVYVDGIAVDEEQFGLENGITKKTYASVKMLQFPQTVPEGSVFVLGDNRTVSEDSRYTTVGMIDSRKILGRALWFIFPFNKIGLCH